MSIGIQLMQQGTPPHLRFEQRAEEDRDATIKLGRKAFKDVDYVILLRPGTKDAFEANAKEWLDNCDKQANQDPPNWPIEWANAHRKMYEQWKAGQEITVQGFPIRQWARVSKAQAENLIMARVMSVEQLAEANEQTLTMIGMGARELKNDAIAWMEANKGNAGVELAALRAENSDLKQSLGRQNDKIAELEAAIAPFKAELQRKRA